MHRFWEVVGRLEKRAKSILSRTFQSQHSVPYPKFYRLESLNPRHI